MLSGSGKGRKRVWQAKNAFKLLKEMSVNSQNNAPAP